MSLTNISFIVRHFFLGYDVALGRTWEFHDHLAARPDLAYRLHLIGRYSGPREDLDRSYVTRGWPLSRPSGSEVWIIRGWNHPLLITAALTARYRRIPTLMWAERPGITFEAAKLKQAVRIRLRERLLPMLFIPYQKDTIVLGTGQDTVRVFRELSKGSPGRVFPYPDSLADACLGSIGAEEPCGVPLLLFLGSFTRRKAVDLIARTCESLWSSGYEFRVRYVGEGPMSGMLEEHVRRSKGRAEIYPFADRAALLQHLGEADAVLLPSRHDGWGLPVHEGLAAGVPVITSDACGAADLIQESGCGRVVRAGNAEDLKEAISWVAGLNTEQRALIRKQALQVAESLTIPKLADLLISYCNEALRLGKGDQDAFWAQEVSCAEASRTCGDVGNFPSSIRLK